VLKVAAVLILFGAPVFLLAQSPAPSGIAITPGAIGGLAATWIGIVMGYINLRRSIKHENTEAIKTEATRIATDLFAARAVTLMDRREQETINRHQEERFRTMASLTELAREIRSLAEAIKVDGKAKRNV
jgi:hypothetical protein